VYGWVATVAYDGTEFRGFQVQRGAGPGTRTVQGALEGALEKVAQAPRAELRLAGAGRTDAGVHAAGQVVSFQTPRDHDPGRLRHNLNALLPGSVRVLGVRPAPPDFSARYGCLSKTYTYDFHLDPVLDPRVRHHRAHVYRGGFDLPRAEAACRVLRGRHDFTQLSSAPADGRERDPVRALLECRCEDLGWQGLGAGVRITVRAPGFLYRQVRHLAGAVRAVAQGRCEPGQLRELLEAGSSRPRGSHRPIYTVAPAAGLSLAAVELPPLPPREALCWPGLPHDAAGRVDGAACLAMEGLGEEIRQATLGRRDAPGSQ